MPLSGGTYKDGLLRSQRDLSGTRIDCPVGLPDMMPRQTRSVSFVHGEQTLSSAETRLICETPISERLTMFGNTAETPWVGAVRETTVKTADAPSPTRPSYVVLKERSIARLRSVASVRRHSKASAPSSSAGIQAKADTKLKPTRSRLELEASYVGAEERRRFKIL